MRRLGIIDELDNEIRPWDPQRLRHLVQLLERASCGEEHDAIRNSELVEVVHGEPTESGAVGRWCYTIRFNGKYDQFRSGVPVLLRRGEAELSALILQHGVTNAGKTVIVIQASRPLEGGASSWAVHEETGSLYAMIRARLREIWPDRGHPNRPFVPDDELICQLLNGVQAPRPVAAARADVAGLNSEQAEAVAQALAHRGTFLWGPAGTGKTTTVARIVVDEVRAGRAVLVVAYTNKAADIAADRIAMLLTEHEAFHHGLILRAGQGSGAALRSRWADRLLRKETLARLHAEAIRPAELDGDILRRQSAGLRWARQQLGQSADARLRETFCRTIRGLSLRERHARGEEVRVDPRWGELRGARVVVSTLHQLVTNPELERKFDTVVIDEASQAPLPLSLIAAAHARQAIIVAGDPRQLPTPTQSSNPDVRRAFGGDLFHESGVLTNGSAALVRLRRQYRMAPDIASFVSELAYDGELVTPDAVRRRTSSALRQVMGSLRWVDTGRLGARVSRPSFGSRLNAAHIDVVVDLIGDLDSRRLLPSSAAVMTPYRAQAAALRRRLKGSGVTVATVHRYQGDEVDCVVLDLTDARGLPPTPFMRANFLRDEGARLLTVAASRARECLIVVGDFDFLERHGGLAVRRFVQTLRRHGEELAVRDRAVG